MWLKLLPIFMLPLVLLATPANATSFYPQPFPESVQNAPNIVRGTTGMSYTDWSLDDSGVKKIYTFYELLPSEILKGNIPATTSLTMREIGGEKDGVGLNVPGVAQFAKGEDTVVLLKERNSVGGYYDIQGMMMGKYGIQKDADGTEFVTGLGTNTFSGFSNNGDGNPVSPPAKKWTMNDLRQLILKQGNSTSESENNPSTKPRAPHLSPQKNPNLAATPTIEPSPAQSAEPSDNPNPTSSESSHGWLIAFCVISTVTAFGLMLTSNSRNK